MCAQLLEFGIRAADVAELGCSEFREVCLSMCKCLVFTSSRRQKSYVYVKPQDRIFLACPLESCDLRLQLVLRLLPLLCGVRCSTVISCSALRSAVLGLGLSLSVGIVVSLLLLRMRFVLWLPLLLLLLFPAATRSLNAFA